MLGCGYSGGKPREERCRHSTVVIGSRHARFAVAGVRNEQGHVSDPIQTPGTTCDKSLSLGFTRSCILSTRRRPRSCSRQHQRSTPYVIAVGFPAARREANESACVPSTISGPGDEALLNQALAKTSPDALTGPSQGPEGPAFVAPGPRCPCPDYRAKPWKK